MRKATRPSTWLTLAGLAALILAASSPAAGGRGRLRPDRTFGGGRGFVTTRIAGSSSVVYGAITVAGGRIVAAGQASPPSGNGQVVVARYLSSGRLDKSFGSGGIFESAFPVKDAPFLANAVAQDPRTGKLIVAGGYGQGSLLLMRLTAAGRLDRTFGTGGRGYTTVPVNGTATTLAIQRDGRILVGAFNGNPQGKPFVVARFTAGGALDRSFGRGGIVQVVFWNQAIAAGAGLSGMVPTSDGGLIASGHIDYIGGNHHGQKGGHGSAGVFRLTRTGRYFRGFGRGGHVQITFFSGTRARGWYPCGMLVDRLGRITVTGGGGIAHPALFTARLTPRGALDRSYGSAGNGKVVTPGLGGNAFTTCGATGTPAGELTVGLASKVAQLLPNGRPNTRFAPRGVFTVATPKQVLINALVAGPRRRLVLGGSAGTALYVGRFLN
jgi:uncharacterized delta-60 repeat protein